MFAMFPTLHKETSLSNFILKPFWSRKGLNNDSDNDDRANINKL